MKSIIYVLLFLSVSLQAQEFTYYPAQENVEEGPADKARDVKVYVTNHTGASLRDWQWAVIDIEQPNDWFGLAICDNVNCFYNLEPGDTNDLGLVKIDSTFSFKVTFGPNSIDSIGIVKIAFFDPSDTTGKADTITLGLDTWALSVSERFNVGLKLYPNPVENYLNIDFGNYMNTKVTVYNFLGQHLIERQVVGSHVKLDLKDLEKGTYFVRWTNGKDVITKRIIKE